MSDDGEFNGRKPRITSVSRIHGSFSSLKNCKCFPEIDRRIRLGWTIASLVSAVQDEFGECKDLSPKYLRKVLSEYRASIPPAELSASSTRSAIVKLSNKKITDGLDEISELERLYKMQVERIEIDFENEKKINKLFNTTGREVFVAMKLLRQSAELKMDLGLLRRQAVGVEISGQLAVEAGERYGKDSIGKVIADPDSRRKVLGIAERLLALGAKASLDAVEMLGQATQEEQAGHGEVIDTTVVEALERDMGPDADGGGDDRAEAESLAEGPEVTP